MDEISKLYIKTRDRHVKNLTRILHGNLESAEDIFHNAMVRAIQYYPTFDSNKGTLEGWFARILFNQLGQYFRKEKKHYVEELSEDEEDRGNSGNDNEMDNLFASSSSYSNCSSSDRNTILNLVFVKGYTYKEVSMLGGFSEYTVKQLCSQFKKGIKNE